MAFQGQKRIYFIEVFLGVQYDESASLRLVPLSSQHSSIDGIIISNLQMTQLEFQEE